MTRSSEAGDGTATTVGAVVDLLPTAAALLAPDGRFARVNQQLCDILGYRSDELVGRVFAELTVPADQAACLGALREMFAGGRTRYQAEMRCLRKDGAIAWMSLSSAVQCDRSRQPRYCLTTFEDITPRKTAELEAASLSARLQAEHARLVAAQAVAKVGSWETELRTLAVTWSQETFRIFERSPDLFVPTHQAFLACVHPDDRAAVDEAFRRSAAGAEPNTIEHRVQFEDGRIKYVEERWQLRLDDSGQPVRAVGTCQDVSERRLALVRLAQSEALLRMAGRAARLGGWRIEWPTRDLVWSDEVCIIHDLPPGETPTLERAMAFYPASRREGIRALVVQCATDGVPFEFETPSTTAAGREVIIRVLGEAVRDDDGRTIRLQGAVQDVTAAHEATRALRESEERFRLLARAANEAIWDWNIARGTTWFGDGYKTLFGFDPAMTPPSFEVWQSRIHPDDLRRVVSGHEAVVASGGELWSDEYRFRREDGSYADVRDRGYVIRDEAGTAVRMVGAMVDLTEQKRASAQLAQQAALLDKAHDAIVVHDLDHRVQYWNRSAELLYGWSAQDVLGRSVPDLLYRDPRMFVLADEALHANGEWKGEIEQVTKSGRTLTVEGHWTLVRDDNGNPASILAINTDATARKQLEQQYLRAQRMESIGTLAGGIAHDLNNVLAPILLSVDFLRRDETDRGRLELLQTIDTSASRGAELVRQVLSFARGLGGDRVAVSPGDVIADVARLMRDTFPKDIRLVERVDAELWTLEADPTQLHQVLLNLCVNARDAMPGGGTITLSASNRLLDRHYAAMNLEATAGPYLVLQVEDTGVGIDPEVIEKIFDPFFTTKEVGKGTGLGLATSLAIVKGHGGFMRVSSVPGHGARFELYFPAIDSAQRTSAVVTAPAPIRGHGETILVVDDEAAIRRLTARTLEAYGYRVRLAADGAEAISTYVQHMTDISLVLTDMVMPAMDGAAAVRVLLRLNPLVRIIGTSGLEERAATDAIRPKLRAFLLKPYTAQSLLAAVHRVLTAP